MRSIVQRRGICFIPTEHNERKRSKLRPGQTNDLLSVFGREIVLTNRESLLIELLITTPPAHIVTRNQILDAWGDDGESSYRAVDAMIKCLRQKVFPSNPKARKIFIETHYGRGYRFPDRNC
ncbi:MAG: Transcriptional regulatory protein terminal [Candidatus Parcubacteria bacterium]|jgi:DNA-binding response OmpR family regulator